MTSGAQSLRARLRGNERNEQSSAGVFADEAQPDRDGKRQIQKLHVDTVKLERGRECECVSEYKKSQKTGFS